MNNFSFLQGYRPQPLEFAGGYNRNSLDFARPLSSFAGGYNQQMNPLDTATPDPVGGYTAYAPMQPPMETAQQIAPSLLAAPSPSGGSQLSMSSGAGGAAGMAEGMVNAMSKVQDSPMLSQVQQMGGRYRRQMQGLLG